MLILSDSYVGGHRRGFRVFLGFEPPVASGLAAAPDGSGDSVEGTQGSLLSSPDFAAFIKHPLWVAAYHLRRTYLTQLQRALQFTVLSCPQWMW